MAGGASIDSRLSGLLASRRTHAQLAAEVGALLGLSRPELDASLARLESEGRIVVVEHPAPDRHLERADLRVVAAVEAGGSRAEAEARAVAAAESAWSAWLTTFLATHRCG